MRFTYYEARWIVERRTKDTLRKAEQVRLIRIAKGHKKSLGQWLVALSKSLLAIWDRRVGKPHRRSLSTTPGLTCECATPSITTM